MRHGICRGDDAAVANLGYDRYIAGARNTTPEYL